ncbi:MAG: hypothetical protein ORN51_03475 [Akkermansiaceae bacterium]|nr:hypothetical protein [Akkermansiaceae bacterium]
MLVSRLRLALQWLNPDLSVEAIEGAVEECSGRDAPATACGETPQPLSAERLLQFASCGIPLYRIPGFHEDDY